MEETTNRWPRCQIVRIEDNIQRNLTNTSRVYLERELFAVSLDLQELDVFSGASGFEFLEARNKRVGEEAWVAMSGLLNCFEVHRHCEFRRAALESAGIDLVVQFGNWQASSLKQPILGNLVPTG